MMMVVTGGHHPGVTIPEVHLILDGVVGSALSTEDSCGTFNRNLSTPDLSFGVRRQAASNAHRLFC